jgi:hypothetical protein
MLEGELEAAPLWAGASQIRSVIIPSMKVARPAQGLAEMGANGLSHVVDDDDGDVIAALQFAQEAEQGGDKGSRLRRHSETRRTSTSGWACARRTSEVRDVATAFC